MTQKGAECVLARPLPPVPPPGPLMLLPPPTGMPPGPNAPVALLPAIPTCGDRARLQLGWNALAMVHQIVNREINGEVQDNTPANSSVNVAALGI